MWVWVGGWVRRKCGVGKGRMFLLGEFLVSMCLSLFGVYIQNGFCRAFPGVSKCLDCGGAEDDLPASRYCRFLEFRKYVPTHNECV